MRLLLVVLGAITPVIVHPHDGLSQSRDTSRKVQPSGLGVRETPACCTIVRIDSARSVVSARETTTGFTFRFAVKTKRLLSTLKVGQAVWADFASKTVKLRAADVTPCCGILTQETP